MAPRDIVRIVVSAPFTSRFVGDIVQLTATATLVDGSPEDVSASAAWMSSDENITSVSSSGRVEVVAPGESTLRASLGVVCGEIKLTAASRYRIVELPPRMHVGTRAYPLLIIAPLGAASRPELYTWTSSDGSVTSIVQAQDGRPTLTALSPGTSTISALLNGSVLVSGEVLVSDVVLQSIQIQASATSFAYYDPATVKAIGSCADQTTFDITPLVVWTTDKDGRIDSTGLV